MSGVKMASTELCKIFLRILNLLSEDKIVGLFIKKGQRQMFTHLETRESLLHTVYPVSCPFRARSVPVPCPIKDLLSVLHHSWDGV